ncbi:MAG TPA: B12-binding domain-containing radical SAM protein [Candidatus Brocadiia bacterium]|nr:radical SAM protein [Candidatus Brocadiales bacterium]
MHINLIFPPSWIPSQPFLSLPSLTAFLRKEGIRVTQRDLNIEFLEVVLTKKKGEEFLSMIRDKLNTQSLAPEKFDVLREVADLLPLSFDFIEDAKTTFRTEDFYDVDKYIESLITIDKYMKLAGALFYPSSISAYDNTMRYSVYSSKEIMAAIQDKEENIFLNIFKQHFLPSILDSKPDVVGISITSTSQIIPGLTLARLIKEREKDIYVTVGGSVFTKLIDNLLKADTFFSFVDSFVAFEGEHALLELANQLSGKKDLKMVPNLIYRENGVTRVNEPFFIEDVNTLPTPDYEGLPLSLYHSPERVLPVQTSRGCYWGKCTFCNLHHDHRCFRPKKTELVLRDINTLKERHATGYFFFADECIPIKSLTLLSKALLESGADIKWIGGVRFEEGITLEVLKDIKASGCQKLVFGLESFSQRVLDLMCKGTKRETIKRVLNNCLETGVSVHLYSIVGFPTETVQEAFETSNFVLSNERLVSSPGFSFLPCLYEMEIHSPITCNPGDFGLRRIMVPKSEDLSLGYFYEVERGMSPQEAEELHAQILQKVNETISPFPYNYSMADGLLYLAHGS